MYNTKLKKIEGGKISIAIEKEVVTTEGKKVNIESDHYETTLETEKYKLLELTQQKNNISEQIKIQEAFISSIEKL